MTGLLARICRNLIFAAKLLAFAAPLAPTAALAQASERMGSFEISEVFLNPVLEFQGEEDGGFLLRDSYFGFQWSRGEQFNAVLKLGSSDLVKPAIFFSHTGQPVQPTFGLTEMYMEGESRIGAIKVGLLKTGFGFESNFQQWTAILPPSLIRSSRWYAQRDYGLQLSWNSSPWETSITVHNGESIPSQDGRFWATAHWLYRGNRDGGFRMLVTAQTGQSKPSSTNASTAAAEGFAFDANEASKIRQGTLAFIYEWHRNLWLLEGHSGQILQKDLKRPFVGGRMDAVVHLGGDLGLLVRHEKLAPDQGNALKNRSASTLGFVLHSKDQLYSLSIYGTAITEEPTIKNDIYGAQFRIRSHLF